MPPVKAFLIDDNEGPIDLNQNPAAARGQLTDAEAGELADLHARAWKIVDVRDGQPVYYRWTQAERDRVRALMCKQYPSLQFAPSTEEVARRFGHLARTKQP